jgi:hypothetical protein
MPIFNTVRPVAKQAIPAPEELHFRKLRAEANAAFIPWQALVLFYHGAKSYEWA